MTRSDGRAQNQLRPIKFERNNGNIRISWLWIKYTIVF